MILKYTREELPCAAIRSSSEVRVEMLTGCANHSSGNGNPDLPIREGLSKWGHPGRLAARLRLNEAVLERKDLANSLLAGVRGQ